jgi:hypothetical protein
MSAMGEAIEDNGGFPLEYLSKAVFLKLLIIKGLWILRLQVTSVSC